MTRNLAPIFSFSSSEAAAGPALSVVVPMYNEAENAPLLVEEIAHAIRAMDIVFEIITVDDCSSDNTCAVLQDLKNTYPELRVLTHGTNAGQSRSVRTGIIAAKSPIIATLDGDGQNNPADIPALYRQLLSLRVDDLLCAMVAGERQKRQDSAAKRMASRFANGVRKRLLKDAANDTGCGLKVFYRDAFMRLPYFDHVHRYLPALFRREGFHVSFAPVSHRPRLHGVSKYTNFQRGIVAIRDLMGVMWLNARARKPETIEEL